MFLWRKTVALFSGNKGDYIDVLKIKITIKINQIEHSKIKLLGISKTRLTWSAPVHSSTNVHPERNPDNRDRIDT